MSWSLSKVATQQEVRKYLDEEAPKVIAHVQGDERALADQALGFARAVVAANPAGNRVSLGMYGSAIFKDGVEQVAQSVSISITGGLPS